MGEMQGRGWYKAHLKQLTDLQLYESTRRVLTVELIEQRELPASADHWHEWVDRDRRDLWAQALAAAKQEVAEHAEANRKAIEELRERFPRRDEQAQERLT